MDVASLSPPNDALKPAPMRFTCKRAPPDAPSLFGYSQQTTVAADGEFKAALDAPVKSAPKTARLWQEVVGGR